MSDRGAGFLAFILTGGLLVGCLVGGCCMGVSAERADAIKAGVARWECDPKTGEAAFRYYTAPATEDAP